MSTRAERSAANRAAHAVKRAKLEEQWALAAAEKQADRKRRRKENRAAWWARYGMATPGIEQAEQVETSGHVTMPEVTEDSSIVAASATRSRGEAGHWFVEMNGVKCGTISWSNTRAIACHARPRSRREGLPSFTRWTMPSAQARSQSLRRA